MRSSTGEHFCQSELQGTVENRSLVAGDVVFDILRCWKDVHLQTSEYSLQVKYKEEVTTTTGECKYHSVPSLPYGYERSMCVIKTYLGDFFRADQGRATYMVSCVSVFSIVLKCIY